MSLIVLLEPEKILYDNVVQVLQSEGFEIVWTESYDQVLENLRLLKPDIILADVTYPRNEGMYLLEEFCLHGIDIPVIILSANTHPSDVRMGFRSGASDYITKPFGFTELLEKIKQILLKKHRGKNEDGSGKYKIVYS